MATVPELKAQAEAMGVKITSRMRKPEIEKAIHEAESASNKINSADPTPTPVAPLSKAERARRAGSHGVSAQPMASAKRGAAYVEQNGKPTLTSAQARRERKKNNKQRGFVGCTLADYREMRRRMKRAGMIPAGQR